MNHCFKDSTVLVIGGSTGMGKASARKVLQGGGKAIIVGRQASRLDAAVAELSTLGEVRSIVADIAKPADVDSLVSRIGDDLNANLLVNAAGLFLPKSFLDHEAADYEQYMR